MSKYNNRRNYNRKRNKKSFEQMLQDYLEESEKKQAILDKRYNRQADSRKIRNKNRGKGDM